MDLARKRVLVVDDHPGMLTSIRRALEACGITGATAVRNAHEAVQRLRNMRYDIVLADFDLGEGPDGQQLLEHCRREQLLAPGAVFVMVTAERAYDRVMAAAECAPDDYLVKPYTEDMLRMRLTRVLQRKQALAAVCALRAKGSYQALVETCERMSAAEPRYAPELEREKGEALLHLGRYGDARELYERVLSARPVPWARLGLALAQEGLGAMEAARLALTELLADAPEYLAAYDALSRLHACNANDADAQAVLRMAIEVSPNALHRHKAVGEIALKTKDYATAEAAFGTVVRKGRNGFVRDPEDHLKFSRILLERNKFAQALETLAEVRKTYREAPAVKAEASVVESMIHSRAENPREARKALDEALAATRQDGVRLPKDVALELARACYLHKREQDGAQIVREIVSNNHDDEALLAGVRQMFGELDRAEQGETLIERCVEDAVAINNEGVARAKSGDLEGAIELLQEAARTMPDNVHIVMNAAHALIAHMQVHGVQAPKQAKVDEYLAHARAVNASHPKYLQVLDLHARLLETYAQAA